MSNIKPSLIIYPKYNVLLREHKGFTGDLRHRLDGLGDAYFRVGLACCVCKRTLNDVSETEFDVSESFWIFPYEFIELDSCFLITCSEACQEIVKLDPSYEAYLF